ncbi:MAG: hypothetical protein QOD75_3560 [Blastocatellia bacterium]|jgi:hypothetical protein|nr:hypothetical protein [Blastocatellia bacterium]
MQFKNSSMISLVAIAILVLVTQVATAAAATPISGKLATRNNKPILVNGNSVKPGTTIFSGSNLQSPAKVGATVDLGWLGRLDMAPLTDVTVVFDATHIDVQLKSGYVVLTTSKGITGKVTTSEGKVFQTDLAKVSSVIARTAGSVGPEVAAPIGAAAGGLSAGAIGGIGAAGAGVIGGAAAAQGSSRGSDLSTDKPRP